MRNPTQITTLIKWTTLMPMLMPMLMLSPIQAVDPKSDGGERMGQWQILTKLNFSSQIRLHRHILLMVTVPWCGESQSLRKQLSDGIIYEQETFDRLKLRLLFRNGERMLADALGATEGITVFYYHQGLSYKYQGRFRIQNVLSSVRYVMSLLPEELPLKILNTPEDVRSFVASADKALLLLEFCGWSSKLLLNGTKNGTKTAVEEFFPAEGFPGSSFSKETNSTLALEEKERSKVMENERIKCDVESSQFHGFTLVNDSFLQERENMTCSGAITCTLEEFQHFEKFLPKFLTVVREFFLPPERLRFGVIHDRSLLSLLNVEYSGSWFVTLQLSGCPGCSKVVKEVDDLRTVLQTQSSVVMELEDHVPDIQPALPASKPSVLLFIDRSSDSFEIREESREALGAFRELALSYQSSQQISRRTNVKPPISLVGTYTVPKSASKHHGLELFPTYQKMGQKDKVSIMIMNEGNHVNVEHLVSDLQGSSLQEILDYVLQKKKQLKLSSVAKEAGFQLLSEDVDIKVVESLPGLTQAQSSQVLGPPSAGALQSDVNSGEERTSYVAEKLDREQEEKSQRTRSKYSELDFEKNPIDLSPHSVQSDGNHKEEIASGQHGKVEQETQTIVDEQKRGNNSWGSFFFCDGQYRLLKALTGGSKIPSVVIIDSILQQHYVLQDHAAFSFSLLSNFLHRYLNGSISPYQQSEPILLKTREAPSPPFINVDFHEVDSIPRVTIRTFTELVFGNQSDTESAGEGSNKNVLVLFSNSWCGFCQRMELVVREAYRAIKGYADMLKEGLWSDKHLSTSDDVKKALLKLPLIYLMDCTLNDCSLILKSMVQRELYPSLLLFPAGSKNPVAYEGDIVVSDIFKFLTDNGGLLRSLVREKGMSSLGAEQEGPLNLQDSTLAKSSHYEVLLKDRTQKVGIKFNQFISHSSIYLHETDPHVVVGSMLIATDKLLEAHPFDGSEILIVKVDQSTGYQGLIINKHISWDSLEELEEGLLLLKEAPLSFGGPVMRRGMPLVALARKYVKDQYLEVLPNIYFLEQSAIINLLEELKSGNQSVYDYWFFLGYSSWGWHQLLHEIAEGAWNVTKGNMELLDWPSR